MTEDRLERQLSGAMGARAQAAVPGSPRFADVERRAARRQRRRSTGLVATGLVSAAALVVVALVVGLRADGSDGIVTGPADTPAVTAPSVTAPSGLAVDRWAVFADGPIVRPEPAGEVVSGLLPPLAGQDDVEVTPYVIAGRIGPDDVYLYALAGSSWTSTVAQVTLAVSPSEPSPSAVTTVLRGTGFDPSRLAIVPDSGNTSRPTSSAPDDPSATGPNPSSTPNPFLNARPEELLAASDVPAPDPPVEHLGAYDWVVSTPPCEPGAGSCRAFAVGGDADQLIIVDAIVRAGADLRAWLPDLQLRTADELPAGAAPGTSEPGSPVVTQTLPPAAGPFLKVLLAPDGIHGGWPVAVPDDYCAAVGQWMAIQQGEIDAWLAPGWVRWVAALAAEAPPEIRDAYATLGAEQRAGRNPFLTPQGTRRPEPDRHRRRRSLPGLTAPTRPDRSDRPPLGPTPGWGPPLTHAPRTMEP